MKIMMQTVSTFSWTSSSSSVHATQWALSRVRGGTSPSAESDRAFQRVKYSSCSKSKSSSASLTSEGTTKGPSCELMSSRTRGWSRSRTFTDQHCSSRLPCQRLSKRGDQKSRGRRTGKKRSWKAALNVSSWPKYMCPWWSLKAMFTPNDVGTGLIGCSFSSSLNMRGKPLAWPSEAARVSSAMNGIRIGSMGTKFSLEEKVSSSAKSCLGQSSQSRASEAIFWTFLYSRTKGRRMLGGDACTCLLYSCSTQSS
mmetsp:Transcript_92535/g.261670  ORF Transcript_92535/g.261670 Transcript_92535/m.261670 type:complete len:254 (-) Transcript_92535:75-836(-)